MDAVYTVRNAEDIPTPALLLYRDLIVANLRRALDMVGDPARLRPHVKTHKMAEIVRMALREGVLRHKCATLKEAEMLADCGAPDVLIAYQMVGPNCVRLAELVQRFPRTEFKSVVDDPDAAHALSAVMQGRGLRLRVLLDLDLGMHRTGIAPGERAVALYGLVAQLPGLEAGGLHAYDGDNRAGDPAEREVASKQNLAAVRELRATLERRGLAVPLVVVGGTPPFPFYARQPDVEASPGTFVLHDGGYGATLPDLGFRPAALLLTRVISRPLPHLATIDLGSKAIAADPPGARGAVLNLPGVHVRGQSEEHWVLELTDPTTHGVPVGHTLYVCPTHVCPTVALHREAYVVANGEVVERWEVTARDRT
jgi:D-serine deaminase-like pyridoxal phosphate-dependent protein